MNDRFWRKKRVLVTGAGGFVGSHTVNELIARGAEVTALTRKKHLTEIEERRLSPSLSRIQLAYGDLQNYNICKKVSKNQDIIFHFAGMDGGKQYKERHAEEIYKNNLKITKNLLKASKLGNVQKFILASSIEVYADELPSPIQEEDADKYPPEKLPFGYRRAKREAELLAQRYHETKGLHVIILRLGSIYGPRDDAEQGRVIPTFIEMAKLGKPMILYEDPKIKKTFIHVQDAVQSIITLTENRTEPGPIHLVGSQEISLLLLASTINHALGNKSRILQKFPKKQHIAQRTFSRKKANEILGKPQEINLVEGLRNILLEHATPVVSVVIVNWNGASFLEKCISSVYNQKFSSLEVIVVDNASQDMSVSMIKNIFPQVIIIQNTKNKGFAHGSNQGAARARGAFLLFLNSDAYLGSDFFSPLIQRTLSNPRIAAIGPKILNAQEPARLDACGSYWSTMTWLYHFGYKANAAHRQYGIARNFFSLKGAAFLVRKDCFQQAGGFDDDFWCYYEESDLCHRFWIMGLQCTYEPQSVAFHIGGASAMNINGDVLQYHNFKNQLQSFMKNFTPRNLAWILPIHITGMIAISLAWVITGRIKNAVSIYQSLWWVIRSLPLILRKRSMVQKKRVISDRMYLSQVTKNPPLSYFTNIFKITTYGSE